MFDIEKFWTEFNQSTKSEKLDLFLDVVGDPNYINANSGWSLLNLAIENKNSDIIRKLAKKGTNLNSPFSNLPIFHALDIDIDSAVQQNKKIDFAITRLLLELGADFEKKDNNNRSLREYASLWGNDVLKKFDQEIGKCLRNEIKDQ